MAEPDPQQLLTALSTEHFTLRGARLTAKAHDERRSHPLVTSVSDYSR
jgi:hypothetical protein